MNAGVPAVRAPRTESLSRRLGLGVSLISAAALGYEVLLTRLFNIVQWHHFAYMIISLALLGFGASGTFLSYAQARLMERFRSAFALNAAAFALTSLAAFALAQRVPFDPLELFWDRSQPLLLLAVYGMLSVPFFFAANCIGLALVHQKGRIARVYFADLVGAGVGALGTSALLFWLFPDQALYATAVLGCLAAVPMASGPRLTIALLLLSMCLPLAWPRDWLSPRPSPYKPLSTALQVQGARLLEQLPSPLGVLAVVENSVVPPRHAPGLSLRSPAEPPAQLEVYTDADAPTAITRYDGRPESVAYLDYLTTALPYHLLERPRVLVLGAGGGSEVLQALVAGASAITAVELNPRMVELVRGHYGEFGGHLFARDIVRVEVGEARAYLEAHPEPVDLIQLALVDSSNASSAGLYALSESYLYTVQAVQAYLGHLRPGGLLSVTRWLQVPPRDCLKLFATAVRALEADQAARPAARLALVRSWRTCTLLVKNGTLGHADQAAIREFARLRSFDAAYYPGMLPGEANRYNVMPEPYLYEGARSLLGPAPDQYLARYKFDISPPTDDRPYFFHFFRWRTLPELLRLPARAGLTLLEGGYLVLVATLVQASLLAVVLILLPLWGRRVPAPRRLRLGVAIYFLALGLAFLFLEIAFLQRFVLYLGHPLYAVAVVLSGFLVFAGLGSLASGRLEERLGARGTLSAAVAAIVLLCSAYLALGPMLLHWVPTLAQGARIAAGLLLIAPLAFFMGMPFPVGLQRLAAARPTLIPWAWGINGCASVISAVAATLLSIHLGFAAVVLLAMVLYGVAAASLGLLGPIGRGQES
jgi:spermidine synthase